MPSPKGRILCTEDDPDTRDLLIFLLNHQGYDVVCTDNAEQALAIARSQTFDLFLVDSWLPDSSGANLTERIREFDNQNPGSVLFGGRIHYRSANCSQSGSEWLHRETSRQ